MSNGNKNLPQLHIEYGPEKGRGIELSSPRFVIGRAVGSDLRLDHPGMSRQHAEIVCEAERYFLADLGSRNGTYLNGERLGNERRLLSNEDRIQIGKLIVLRFEDPATTVADSTSTILSPGLWLDMKAIEVYVRRRKLKPRPSPRLFKLLAILIEHKGEIVSNDQIAEKVWPDEIGVTPQMIDTLVTRLRKRLAEIDPHHQYVETVRGAGRRFVQRG